MPTPVENEMARFQSERRFTREQLEFVVEIVLASAFDRIESCVPDATPLDEFLLREESLRSFMNGAMQTAGLTLSVLYAQLTDDCIGITGALQICSFEEVVGQFVKTRLVNAGPQIGEECFPSWHRQAEAFVSQLLGNYLVQAIDDNNGEIVINTSPKEIDGEQISRSD